MNKYRKTVSHRNRRKKTLRKSLKRKQKKITLNNKFRKRYQIGCSRKQIMSGGTGIGAFQPIMDAGYSVSHTTGSFLNNLLGTPTQPSPSPMVQPN
jgi:hypothetical protein